VHTQRIRQTKHFAYFLDSLYRVRRVTISTGEEPRHRGSLPGDSSLKVQETCPQSPPPVLTETVSQKKVLFSRPVGISTGRYAVLKQISAFPLYSTIIRANLDGFLFPDWVIFAFCLGMIHYTGPDGSELRIEALEWLWIEEKAGQRISFTPANPLCIPVRVRLRIGHALPLTDLLVTNSYLHFARVMSFPSRRG